MVDANELARQTLAEARERRLIETAERNDNPPPPISTYAGFDCKTGEALLRPAGGGIVRGQPLYNTAVRPGDIMDLHVSQGLPKADSLSAWEPEVIDLTPEPEEVYGNLIILFRTPDGGLWIGGDREKPERIGTWDSDKTWTISKTGTGKRKYVVTGISNRNDQINQDVFSFVRYGERGSALVDNLYDGAIEPVLGDENVYARKSQSSGAILFGRTIRPADAATQGGAILNPIDTKTWGMVGIAPNPINVNDPVGTQTTISANFSVVFFGMRSSALGSFALDIVSSKVDEGFSSQVETQGTLIGEIVLGSGITLPYSWSYARQVLPAITITQSYSIPIFNFVPFFYIGVSSFYANTTDSAFIYVEEVVDTDMGINAKKTWLHTASDRVEILPPIPTFSQLNMVDLTMYHSISTSFNTKRSTLVDVYTVPSGGGKYTKTQEITVSFFPIPEDATAIDWSYHP